MLKNIKAQVTKRFANFINFTPKTSSMNPFKEEISFPKPLVKDIYEHSKNISKEVISEDTPDIIKNLKPGKKINEGLTAEVFYTNIPETVLRLRKGYPFEPWKMKTIEDPNGIILATDLNETMQLMKFIKGEPLYGKGWDISKYPSKREYMKTFEMINKLPDETFSNYIKDVIKIRKNGYDIDEINPNNLLLDGIKINIIDLSKRTQEPKIKIDDFNSMLDAAHMQRILKSMDVFEIDKFCDAIKNFYNRIIEIAANEGYIINMPELNHCKLQNITTYLYHKDWEMLETITKRRLK